MNKIRIRILTSLATMARTFQKDDVTDWDEADAQRLFQAGYAEPVSIPTVATKEKR